MRQNGAADNRQIRIRAKEIVRVYIHEAQEAGQRLRRQLHRNMLPMKHDAVFVVINVWRVLEEPRLPVQLKRQDAQVLAGGVVYPACIPDIFAA